MCSFYEEVRGLNGEVCSARDPKGEGCQEGRAVRRAMRPRGNQTCEPRGRCGVRGGRWVGAISMEEDVLGFREQDGSDCQLGVTAQIGANQVVASRCQ